MKIYFLLLFSIALLSCNQNKSYINVDNLPDSRLLIKDWYTVGPFETKNEANPQEINHFAKVGKTESEIEYSELSALKKDSGIKVNQIIHYNSLADFNKLLNYDDKTTIDGNIYCACILKSSKARTMKLNFSSDDGSKIWLNHNLILNMNRPGGVHSYENLIDLNLTKGNNFLLIKVHNMNRGWQMAASLEEDNAENNLRYKKFFSANNNGSFLTRSIIQNNLIRLKDNFLKGVFRIDIVDHDKTINNSKLTTDSALSISFLKEGLYELVLYLRNDTFKETIFKGDAIACTKSLFSELIKLPKKVDEKRNINALFYRLNHLLKKENQPKDAGEQRDWDNKIIAIYKQLIFYKDLLKSNYKISDYSGNFLKSYISKIDSGIQYYQVHIPKSYKKNNPSPLYIIMPVIISRFSSYLETQRVALINNSNLFERLANKYNIIIFEPHCRTLKVNYNSIDEVDFWESLEKVKQEYNIDTTKIYLNGQCLAARDALKLSVKNPDKFAAISLISPEPYNSTLEITWLQQNEPINYLKNIKNIPILIIHSEYDQHNPVKGGDSLWHAAKIAGLDKIEYRKIYEPQSYYDKEYMEDALVFCLKYSNKLTPQKINFSTSQLKNNISYWITINSIEYDKTNTIDAEINNNVINVKTNYVKSFSINLKKLPYNKKEPLIINLNGKNVFKSGTSNLTTLEFPKKQVFGITKNKIIEGPFAHVFSNHFIIVKGTSGSKAETKEIESIADTINALWQDKYYSGCSIKSDNLISQKDILESNLVLIGNTNSNKMIIRMIQNIPIELNSSFIKIKNRTIMCNSLCFYLIYPNPLNPTKYVAIISYNNPSFISAGFESINLDRKDISNYGWYDYKVWNYNNSSKPLLYGYFDYNWK